MKQYQLRDPESNAVVFLGSAKECADFLGVSDKALYVSVARGRDHCAGYYVETAPDSEWSAEDWKAIGRWDRFMAPLRRKYGIAVRQGGAT